MENRRRKGMEDFFRQFLGVEEGGRAADNARAVEQMFKMYPAPEPDQETLATIKQRLAAKLSLRQRVIRVLHRSAAAAAVILLMAMLGLFGRGPQSKPDVSYAALIPAVIWESVDIAADDLDIVYYESELNKIEAEVRALEAGDTDSAGARALDEVEMELVRIDTQFWKE